jgi:hypothetical protein
MSYRPTIGGKLRKKTSGVDTSQAASFCPAGGPPTKWRWRLRSSLCSSLFCTCAAAHLQHPSTRKRLRFTSNCQSIKDI